MNKNKYEITENENRFLTFFDNLSRNKVACIENNFKNNSTKKELLELTYLFNCLNPLEKENVINNKDFVENTLLMDAVKCDNETLANSLIDLGFDINAINSNGKTILIESVLSNNKKVFEKLLECNVDVNKVRINSSNKKIGSSALGFACELGLSEMVKSLIDAGADVNYQNDLLQPAIFYCCNDKTKGNSEGKKESFLYLMNHKDINLELYDMFDNYILELLIKFSPKETVIDILNNGFYVPKQLNRFINEAKNFPINASSNKQSIEVQNENIELVKKYFEVMDLKNKLTLNLNKDKSENYKVKI